MADQLNAAATHARAIADQEGHARFEVEGFVTDTFTSSNLEEARADLHRLALERASLEGADYLVELIDPEGEWLFRITASGEVIHLAGDDESPIDEESAWRGDADEGDELNTDVLPASPDVSPFLSEPTSLVPRSEPRRVRLRWPRSRSRQEVAVIFAAVVALGVVGTVAWGVLVGDRSGPVPMVTEAGQRVPGTPPAEWTGPVAWSTPPLLGEGGPPRVTVIGSDRVLVTTADRRLSMVRGSDGATLWSADLPDGEVHGQVVATSIGGTYVVAGHVGDRLTWWSLDTGDELGAIDLPRAAVVSFGGRSPLVGVSATEVGAIVDGQLRTTTVPQGATALAAAPDGRLTIASPTGWWHVPAGQQLGQTAATPWPYASTTPVELRPVSACGDVLVTVVPGESGLATAVLYTDESEVEWRAQGAIRLDGSQVAWRCSTSRSWGILGRTLLGFDTGEVTDLGPWTTTQLASDRALGTVGTQRVITGPDLERGVLPADEAFPDDLVRMGSESEVGALVRWTVDGAPRVYALTPSAAS